jgi:mono/diheme cytochrome c family protein
MARATVLRRSLLRYTVDTGGPDRLRRLTRPSGTTWNPHTGKIATMIRFASLALALNMGIAGVAQAGALLEGDAANGRVLHDKHCTSCHVAQFGGDGSAIYTRADHRVRSIEGLMGQVQACNANVGTNLTPAQVDDIVKFLNEQYYKFD